MFELTGRYNTAKIFTNASVEDSTISQILSILNEESIQGSRIRIMPDCHAGAGCVVGTTMTIQDSVIPNLVGVDIGCGMLAVRLRETKIDLDALDATIRVHVPAGAAVWDDPIYSVDYLDELLCDHKKARLKPELAAKSLGTLGGGNHFIEVDEDASGQLWLVIHSGSRHIGIEVCDFYQKSAYEDLTYLANHGNIQTKSAELIEKLRAEGREKEISTILTAFRKNYTEKKPTTPFDMAYCTGKLMEDYLHDMGIVQYHAGRNRRLIADAIIRAMGLTEEESFDTIHNYIDLESRILRKGSISAKLGERVLIPMNMRDGSLIAIGNGNEDWNFSAPHGAGRLFSRGDAKRLISLEEYQEAMVGIYTSCVGYGTIDESPMAYKPMEQILDVIQDTVDVVDIIKPVYNFKAGK